MTIESNVDEQVNAFEEKTNASAKKSDDYGLRALTDMQSLGRVLATRELRRLKNKFGDSDPRVKDLQDGLKRTFSSLQETEKMKSNLAVIIPETEEGETLLHGKIKDEAGKGVSGLTVMMHDSNGNELAVDKARTDSAGYFFAKISPQLMDKAREADWVFSIRRDDGEVIYTHDNTIKLAAEKNLLINTVVSRDKLRPAEVSERLKSPVAKKATTRRKAAPVDVNKLKEEGYILLGNKRSKEIHDLDNIQKMCQIDEISQSNRVPFSSEEEAVKKGYDYCAYCFGPEKSKH